MSTKVLDTIPFESDIGSIELGQYLPLLGVGEFSFIIMLWNLNRMEALNPDIYFPEHALGEDDNYYNYLQIFRKTLTVWDSVEAMADERKRKLREFVWDMSRAFYYGKRSIAMPGYRRTMGGLDFFIPTFEYNDVVFLNNHRWEMFLRFIASKISSNIEYWVFVHPKVYKQVTRISTADTVKEYMIPIARWITPHGIFNIMADQGIMYSPDVFVISDFNNVKYKYLKFRDMQLLKDKNREYLNFRDMPLLVEEKNMEYLLSECGLWLTKPETMLKITIHEPDFEAVTTA